MDKRMSTRIKISGIILLFSVMVTGLFILSLLWFGKTVQNMKPSQSSIYLVTTEDYVNILEGNYFMPSGTGNIMGIEDYNSRLQNEILQKLLPVAGGFLILFAFLSICLWKVLQRFQNKQMLDVAKSLVADKNNDKVISNTAIMSVYQTLQQQFNNLLEDNKRLYAYLSHEQKNAIAVLRTNLELSGQNDYLEAMDELSNGIDDILTLSETASTAILVPIDVSLICAELYDRYQKIYSKLTFDFDGNEDTEIMAKSRWIYRAVSNLLDNAIKYGCGKPISLSVEVRKGSVIVKVQDQGIGIEKSHLDKIFQNRYRVNELNKMDMALDFPWFPMCVICAAALLWQRVNPHMEQHFIFLFRKQERISIQLTFDVLYSECQSNKGKEQTMYIIQNALKNLARNKGRNLLVGIITFFLILSTTVALTINSTTNEIIQDYKTRFGSKISFQVDFDKLMAENSNNQNGNMSFPTAPNITSEQYIQFAASEYLKTYQMDILARIGIPKLEPIGGRKGGATFYGEDGEEQAALSYDAKLLAYSDTNSLPDFADGLRKIIEGKMFAKANECLISADFANLNSLTVGDSFSVTEVMGRQEVTLTVSGIYADATQATPEAVEGVISLDGASANRRNEILVNMDTMEQCFDVKNLAVHAEYELKSPEYLKAFTKEVREKGLPDVYTVVTDEESYNKIVTPVEGLAKITMTFMIVVLLIGGAILLLVTAMAIRERKYEIGVLRAMGMKKAKAALMLVIEMVTITAICLVVGLGIGSVLAQPVADVLIAGQAEAAQNLQAIQVHLMPATSLQIALIALLLALLSSIAGVIFITKYEPMKILSERN